jgi:H-NS histone family
MPGETAVPKMNLEKLSGDALRARQRRRSGVIQTPAGGNEESRRPNLLLAADIGLSGEEVFRRGKGGKSPANYQHLEDRDLTQPGRGKRPGWVNAWLQQDKTLGDLQIKEQASA